MLNQIDLPTGRSRLLLLGLGVLLIVFYLFWGLFQYMDGDVGIYHAVPYQLLQGKYPILDYGFLQGPAYAFVSLPPLLLSATLFSSRLYFSLAALGLIFLFVSLYKKRSVQWLALLFLLTQLEFTQELTDLGTKSSVLPLLASGSIALVTLYLYHFRSVYLWIASVLAALVVLSKVSYLSLPFFIWALLFLKGGERRGSSFLQSFFCFIVACIAILAPILLVHKGQNFLENMRLLSLEQSLRHITFLQGVGNLAQVIKHLLINLLPIWYLLFLERKSILEKLRSAWNSPSCVDFLFLATLVYFVLYFVSLYAVLFPNCLWVYGGTTAGLLAIVVLYFVENLPEKRSDQLLLFSLLAVSFSFNWIDKNYDRVAHWRLDRHDFEYSVLGRNAIVGLLDDLSKKGHARYLYLGGYQAELIPSRLPQSEYSVTGLSIDGLVKPGREKANQLKFVCDSNLDDVLRSETAVVLNYRYFEKARLKNYEERIASWHFDHFFEDGFYRVYWKSGSAEAFHESSPQP